MKTIIIRIVSVFAFIALSNIAFAQQAPSPEPQCPCNFSTEELVKMLSTVKNGMGTCTVTNVKKIDNTKQGNDEVASGISLVIASEESHPQQASQTTSKMQFMQHTPVQWMLLYSNSNEPSPMPTKYCSTNLLDRSAMKPITYNEYLLCLRSILLAAKAANIECIPIIKFSEPMAQTATQPVAQQPAMMDYAKIREYFAQITPAATPYKVAVQACIEKTGSPKGCNAGTNGIPAPVTTPTGSIQEITVVDGFIKITPAPKDGIKVTDNYVVYPEYTNGVVKWETTGGAVTQGYAD